ncbi:MULTISPECIES: NUDIX hydrolase [Caldilinea]|jgi:8-oxo-dGTP pyrophosphatase MutT (NUDIX family)|uniref:NUDIX domain-containing protein n=2 Tax=Caldilinea aerophila TaxID=133453 RepID=A0A7C1JKF2_9CHLR|nr:MULTISPECIES: NUDIX domain-containing protein [Caldilinea]MBO9391485.1 NUDIX domain-containing protein [Caldilinea sp.]BAM01987.1 putative NTP pyrophosphohydrolase [Caldilinea aerophila DSM 14535 = NBRC 104270]GIV75186.1 MAG: DNA mismatch repair protein MutT [Caldilinea sp.]
MALKQYDSAGGVVIDDRGRMLLLDRPTRREVRLPKGHVDPGETPEETALRETREESGYADLEIIADLGAQVVKFTFQGDDFVRTEHYFLMRLLSDRTIPRTRKDEAQFSPVWAPLEEAVQRLTFEAEQQFAQRAIDAYHKIKAQRTP